MTVEETSNIGETVDPRGILSSDDLISKIKGNPDFVEGNNSIYDRYASFRDEIEKQGGNSFRDYSIPDAVLRFRQGIGRLIRSKSDKGIIVILDKWVVSKFYGRNFLNSIPYKRKMM